MSKTQFKRLRMITTRSASCPENFGLTHRRVFSYLAFRSRIGHGATQRELGRETRTNTRSVRKALEALQHWGLVVEKQGIWCANEPTGAMRSWFAENGSPKFDSHWFDWFCYSPLMLPRREGTGRRLTINQAHVYSILASLGRKNKEEPGVVERIGPARISKLLNGLGVKTVRTALSVLEKHRLAVSYQRGLYQTIHVLPVGKPQTDLFEVAERNSTTVSLNETQTNEEVRFVSEEAQSIYKECRREGFPIEVARDVTTVARMVGLDFMAFCAHSEIAQVEHAKSRLSGKVSIEHHGHLLLYKLKKVREQQDQIEERMTSGPTLQSMNEKEGVANAALRQTKPPSKQDSVGRPSQSLVRNQAIENGDKQAGPPQRLAASNLPTPDDDYCRTIGSEIAHTSAHLQINFGHKTTLSDIREAIKDGRLKKWYEQGKVSPYFLVLTPEVKKVIEPKSLDEVFGRRCLESATLMAPLIQEFYDEWFGSMDEFPPGDELNQTSDLVSPIEDPDPAWVAAMTAL